MYKNIQKELIELREKDLIAIIDEGRSKKTKEKCRIKGIYSRIFTIQIKNYIRSFSYADLICRTIILKKV